MALVAKNFNTKWEPTEDGQVDQTTGRGGLERDVTSILRADLDWSKKPLELDDYSIPDHSIALKKAAEANAKGKSAFMAKAEDAFIDPMDGMIFVDAKTLRPMTAPKPTRTTRQFTDQALAQLAYKESQRKAGTPAAVRSARLWRTINPGCMVEYAKTPIATTQDHYQHIAKQHKQPNKRLHFQKSDYTEYVECKLKFAHQMGART